MTRAIHEVHIPTTSTTRSMTERTRSNAGASGCRALSGTADLAVVDGLAVARPTVVLGLEGEVGIVDLFGNRVLGDRLVQHFLGGRAQLLDNGVRKLARDDALG